MDNLGWVEDHEESIRYQGTPYDRATYVRLQRRMAPIQAATNDSHKRFNKRGMSPPPTTQGYRDKEQYLFVNKDIFERETAAMDGVRTFEQCSSQMCSASNDSR